MILSGVITNLLHLIICLCHFLVVHRLPIDTIGKPRVRKQVGKMLQVVYTYIPPRASVLKVKSIWNEKKQYMNMIGRPGLKGNLPFRYHLS